MDLKMFYVTGEQRLVISTAVAAMIASPARSPEDTETDKNTTYNAV